MQVAEVGGLIGRGRGRRESRMKCGVDARRAANTLSLEETIFSAKNDNTSSATYTLEKTFPRREVQSQLARGPRARL